MDETEPYDFFKSLFWAKSFSIGNFRLKPLTLGHLILFELLDVKGFQLKEGVDTLLSEDIINFFLITTHNHKENIKLLNSKTFSLKRWWLTRKLKKLVAKEGIESVIEKMSDYYNYYINNVPNITKSVNQDKVIATSNPGTPNIVGLFVKLVRFYRFGWNDIYDIPYSTAATLNYVYLEMEGLINISMLDNEEYEDFWKYTAEQEKLYQENPNAFIQKMVASSKDAKQ